MTLQKFKKRLFTLTLIFLFCLIPIPIHAQTTEYNCDATVQPGQSIQAAINSSSGNQTICVQYGTYQEQITVNKPGTILTGIPNAEGELPIIHGQYQLPRLTPANDAGLGRCPGTVPSAGKQCLPITHDKLVRITATNVTVQNLDINESLGVGIAAYGNNLSNINIKNNIIRNSRNKGIELHPGVHDSIVECNDVYRNSNYAPFYRIPHFDRGGLDWGSGVMGKGVKNVSFINNRIHENWGEGLLVDANIGGTTDIVVRGNHLYDNYALQTYLHAVSNVVYENNFNYHSPNPEFWRGSRASQCLAIVASEGQYAQRIPTRNIQMNNNIFAGCGINYSIWGGIVSNINFSHGTLYTTPSSGYRNYSHPNNSPSYADSSNNLSIGTIGQNPLGGDTNYPNPQAAGITGNLSLERGMNPQEFSINNYTGTGADLSKFPNLDEQCIPRPSTNTTTPPTTSISTTPTPSETIIAANAPAPTNPITNPNPATPTPILTAAPTIAPPPNQQINFANTPRICQVTNLLRSFISITISVAGIATFITILISGIQWLIAGLNDQMVVASRNTFTWAIIGIALILGSLFILLLIQQFTGLNLTTLTIPWIGTNQPDICITANQ